MSCPLRGHQPSDAADDGAPAGIPQRPRRRAAADTLTARRKRSRSTPGASRSMRRPGSAAPMAASVWSLMTVIRSTSRAIARSSGPAGPRASPASAPWVSPSTGAPLARRSRAASSPSGHSDAMTIDVRAMGGDLLGDPASGRGQREDRTGRAHRPPGARGVEQGRRARSVRTRGRGRRGPDDQRRLVAGALEEARDELLDPPVRGGRSLVTQATRGRDRLTPRSPRAGAPSRARCHPPPGPAAAAPHRR
jgi:hypothetical protein